MYLLGFRKGSPSRSISAHLKPKIANNYKQDQDHLADGRNVILWHSTQLLDLCGVPVVLAC